MKIFPEHFSNEVTWSIELGTDVAVIEDGILKPLRGENGLQEFNNGGAEFVLQLQWKMIELVLKRFLCKISPYIWLTLTMM